MRLKDLSIILSFIGCANFCGGQHPPVSWRFSAHGVTPSEWILRISASLAPGWHIYSQHLAEGGPMPTTIRLVDNGDYFQLGSAIEEGVPVQFYDSIYEMEITWFTREIAFLQKIRLNEPVSLVRGTIDYLACNDHLCIPHRMDFAVPIHTAYEKD